MIAEQGIEPYEVLQVLRNREAATPMRHPTGVVILAVVGTTKAGRRLTVYIRPEGGFDSTIVGAEVTR
jgi:hypothetical protein